MIRESLVSVVTCEMSGRVRGKGFPLRDLPSRLRKGVGWVPTNAMINCFGTIPATPFGTGGDLILVPDGSTEVHVDFADGKAPEHFLLGDIRHLDGTPWSCCPRDFAARALAALKAEAGLTLFSAFEHEFTYSGVPDLPGSPYSLDAWRQQGCFAEHLVAALRMAGAEPDSFMPEYGAQQYEIVVDAATGLRSADRAVVVREMVRATAYHLGHRASFTPIMAPDGVGNGVHLHFSFLDANGQPAMYAPSAEFGLTDVARHFVAGILHHLPALAAITAPSAVSYIRLRPNRWAPTHVSLQSQDRGAALRVCPVGPWADAARQFNVEYRVADGAASPYLVLGAVVWAGLEGIRAGMQMPADAPPLPSSLGAALDALEADTAASGWLGPEFLAAYLMHKRGELSVLDGLDEAAQCARYAATY
jgi:glutamine synthetase